MLNMALLGPPVIAFDDDPMGGFVSRKVQALLFYLAVTGRPATRDELMALLWGEMPNKRARGNLRTALANLRRVLPVHLLVSRQAVSLNQIAPYWLDVIHFSTALSGKLADQEPQALQTAVDLYRGDFLSGFQLRDAPTFEEWALREQQHLHILAINGLDWLVNHYLDTGQTKPGLAVSRRLLALEPWRETAHKQRMVLLARDGQRSAALQQYEQCRQVLQAEFAAEPLPETSRLYKQIKMGELASSGADLAVSVTSPSPAPTPNDLNRLPQVPSFIGRHSELAQLMTWVTAEQCRLLTIVGIGGQGKTTLAAYFARALSDTDTPPDRFLWRSLVNAPPLEQLLRSWIHALSNQTIADLPPLQDEQFALLADLLRRQRCLLVLDNVESIMAEGKRAGHCRPNYEGYEQLFHYLATADHTSCLLLTSRERPKSLLRLAADIPQVRFLPLAGLTTADASQLLDQQAIDAEATAQLVVHYSGNPLALKLAATTIQELYGGDAAAFLTEDTFIFDDIRDVLDQQFGRLLPLEQELLLWLAVEREPTPAQTLWNALAQPPPRKDFLEALRSLQRRSLMEQTMLDGNGRFTLQNVVTEYLTDVLVDGICEELERGKLARLNTHTLVKAQSYDYVKESQRRLLLQPIVRRLLRQWGQAGAVEQLQNRLDDLRPQLRHTPGYASANLLHLLIAMEADLRGADFSRLTVWHADLRDASLPAVNFAQADLRGSLFRDVLGMVYGVAFSPDGGLLAAATYEGEIRLWRTADTQLLGQWQVQTICRSLYFSPDGRTLATGGADNAIRLWNISEVKTLGHGHLESTILTPDDMGGFAFSHDGQLVAARCGEDAVYVWRVADGRCVGQIPTYSGFAALAFRADVTVLACGHHDGTIRLWQVSDPSQAQLITTLHGHTDAVYRLAFCPNGSLLASASGDRTVRLWDSAELEPTSTVLQGHTHEIWSVAFSPDGQTVASGDGEGHIRLWDVQSRQCQQTLVGHQAMVVSLAFSPQTDDDGLRLASGSMDHTVRLWRISRPGQAFLYQTLQGHTNYIFMTTFSPDGHLLATAGDDGTIRLWNDETGRHLGTLPGHRNSVMALAFSSQTAAFGYTLASASRDHTVRLWHIDGEGRGQRRHTLRGHSSEVSAVAFSPDGRTVASGGTDCLLCLWDVGTGRRRHALQRHPSVITTVAFDPKSGLLASGGYDGLVRLWNVDSGDLVTEFGVDSDRLNCLIFSPDGALLVGGFYDGRIYVWQMSAELTNSEMQPLTVLYGHTDVVSSLAFAPHLDANRLDGRYDLASGGYDERICLWKVGPGGSDLIATIEGAHENGVFSLSFHPDGQTLVSNGHSEAIHYWDVGAPLTTNQPLRTLRAELPYAGMRIEGTRGITGAQRAALRDLGAVG